MNAGRWESEIERQRELLQIEEDVVLDLLEEIHEIELDPGNVRDLSGERATLKRHLTVLAGERARLDQEAGSFEASDLPASPQARERPLTQQISQVEQLLGRWRAASGLGRRRRMRDHVWLDALLLEKARLQAELRRVEQQRGL